MKLVLAQPCSGSAGSCCWSAFGELAVELRFVRTRLDEHARPGCARRAAATAGVHHRGDAAALAAAALGQLDRLTGELVCRRATDVRWERDRPGELLHVDAKKLGRMPDGRGWRVHGPRLDDGRQSLGWDFVHAAIDARTRSAYAEVLPDETGLTCAACKTTTTTSHDVAIGSNDHTPLRCNGQRERPRRSAAAWLRRQQHPSCTKVPPSAFFVLRVGSGSATGFQVLTKWSCGCPHLIVVHIEVGDGILIPETEAPHCLFSLT